MKKSSRNCCRRRKCGAYHRHRGCPVPAPWNSLSSPQVPQRAMRLCDTVEYTKQPKNSEAMKQFYADPTKLPPHRRGKATEPFRLTCARSHRGELPAASRLKQWNAVAPPLF